MVGADAILPRAQPVCFEIIIGRLGIVLRVAGAASAVELMLYACIEGVLRFLFRQELSVSVFGRAFHGCNAEARPISLQIWLAVRQAGHGPDLSAGFGVRLGSGLRVGLAGSARRLGGEERWR